MTSIRILVACGLLACALPTMAAQTGRDCETRAKQVPSEKRDDFLQSCLQQASTPANVREVTQQSRRRTCEQNAKNLKLNPDRRPGYMEECLRRNEAETVAKKFQVAPRTTLATAPATKPAARSDIAPPPPRSAQQSASQNCVRQARARALKGAARKKFLHECRAG